MKIVTTNELPGRKIVCNEDNEAGEPCTGEKFQIFLSAGGTRLLRCEECGCQHEIEQMMDEYVAK